MDAEAKGYNSEIEKFPIMLKDQVLPVVPHPTPASKNVWVETETDEGSGEKAVALH